MDTIKAIRERRSVRRYLEKKMSRASLEEIVDAGRHAPSGRNERPIEFVVVTKKETLEKISKIATNGGFIKDASACIIVCSKPAKYFLEDGSAASENILLAAKGIGLGGCWVAGHKKDYVPRIKELLKMPRDYEVVSILPIGYPDGEPEVHERREFGEVVHWEEF